MKFFSKEAICAALFLLAAFSCSIANGQQSFPDCSTNATACDDNTEYPFCVTCFDSTVLCSASQEGCGCFIPEEEGGPLYVDHSVVFESVNSQCKTENTVDMITTSTFVCENGELVLRGFADVPCPESQPVCFEVEGKATCTETSGGMRLCSILAIPVGAWVVLLSQM